MKRLSTTKQTTPKRRPRPNENTVDLRTTILKAYHKAFHCQDSTMLLYGGAGSGKSVFAAQKLVLRAMMSKHHFLVFRKVGRTCRASVFLEIASALEMLQIGMWWDVNKTEMMYTNILNGSVIRCLGLDEVEKLKSIKDPTGAWMEEGTEFAVRDFRQIKLRIRGPIQDNDYYQVIVTCNPVSASSWTKTYLLDNHIGKVGTYSLLTTYRDNPFLRQEYIDEILRLKEVDEYYWQVYGEGKWGSREGLVFAAPKLLSMNKWPKEFQDEAYGLDFGFNNPAALVWVGLTDINWTTRTANLYIRELLYGSGIPTPRLIHKMRDELNIGSRQRIWCDSADPGRIYELRDAGLRAVPTLKGQNSVLAGIALLQGLTWHVDPGSVNLLHELDEYRWDTDKKSGDAKDVPIDSDNHALSGVRYAVYSIFRTRKRTVKVNG
jgi:phage terminase large subunit